MFVGCHERDLQSSPHFTDWSGELCLPGRGHSLPLPRLQALSTVLAQDNALSNFLHGQGATD